MVVFSGAGSREAAQELRRDPDMGSRRGRVVSGEWSGHHVTGSPICPASVAPEQTCLPDSLRPREGRDTRTAHSSRHHNSCSLVWPDSSLFSDFKTATIRQCPRGQHVLHTGSCTA